MENKPENTEPKAGETRPEWKKPMVTEFDVNSITLSSFTPEGVDNVFYS
jgi:hypothetical protein